MKMPEERNRQDWRIIALILIINIIFLGNSLYSLYRPAPIDMFIMETDTIGKVINVTMTDGHSIRYSIENLSDGDQDDNLYQVKVRFYLRGQRRVDIGSDSIELRIENWTNRSDLRYIGTDRYFHRIAEIHDLNVSYAKFEESVHPKDDPHTRIYMFRVPRGFDAKRIRIDDGASHGSQRLFPKIDWKKVSEGYQ